MTTHERNGKPIAPAGRWTLQFHRLAGIVRAHAWVQRDDSIYGYPSRGRQSYFDHPAYLDYDKQGRPLTGMSARRPPARCSAED